MLTQFTGAGIQLPRRVHRRRRGRWRCRARRRRLLRRLLAPQGRRHALHGAVLSGRTRCFAHRRLQCRVMAIYKVSNFLLPRHGL